MMGILVVKGLIKMDESLIKMQIFKSKIENISK